MLIERGKGREGKRHEDEKDKNSLRRKIETGGEREKSYIKEKNESSARREE